MKECYIYPCNAANFDIDRHFKDNDQIVWRAIGSIKPDDTVFVYVGKTKHEIGYKCRVLPIEVSEEMLMDNSYAIPKGKIANRCKYVVLEKVCKYKDGTYPLDELKNKGMRQFMVPMKATETLVEYLKSKDQSSNRGDE